MATSATTGVVAGLAVLAVTGALAGCGTAPESVPGAATDQASPVSSGPKPTRWPAAAAGGACQLLDYAVVEQALGVTFEVAAGGQQDATYTCVLQGTGVTLPDLALAVTPTNADVKIFQSTVTPKGATAVPGLGKAGYRAGLAAAPATKRGPGVEIGWLSGNNRIVVLRFTFPPEPATTPEIVAELTTKLTELAKTVDTAGIR